MLLRERIKLLVRPAVHIKLSARIHAVCITLHSRVPCSHNARLHGLRVMNIGFVLCTNTNCHQQLIRDVSERAHAITPIARAGTLLTVHSLPAN